LLVANGHRLADIWGYSIRAIQVYVDLIHARNQRSLHDLTVAVRHTQGSDAKVFKDFLASLVGDTDVRNHR